AAPRPGGRRLGGLRGRVPRGRGSAGTRRGWAPPPPAVREGAVTTSDAVLRLQRKVDTLPDTAGVYLWKDAAGEVIYVGKAKNLRARVRSYLQPERATSPKDELLRRLIADVETIVVESEAQSLLLENNLIKEYQPRLNVRLKDDKSYPSIAVTVREPFPRVLVTRRRDLDARYFGPY